MKIDLYPGPRVGTALTPLEETMVLGCPSGEGSPLYQLLKLLRLAYRQSAGVAERDRSAFASSQQIHAGKQGRRKRACSRQHVKDSASS